MRALISHWYTEIFMGNYEKQDSVKVYEGLNGVVAFTVIG